jgi:tetratricopeptide (TPR) repeat protein
MARIDEHDEELVRHHFEIDSEEKKKKGLRFSLGTRQKSILLISLVVVLVVGAIGIITYIYKEPEITTGSKKGDTLFPGDIRSREVTTTNENLKQGIASYDRGYYTDAITEFTEVVESDADDRDKSTALLYLGMIHENRGEEDRAIEYYKRAGKYSSLGNQVPLHMASAYRKKGDYKQAEEFARKALDKEQKDPEAHILLGNIYYDLGRFKEAIEVYRQALEIEPDNAPLLFNLASAQLKEGDEFAAIENLKKAAGKDRAGEVAFRSWSRLGALFIERRNYEQAVQWLEEALRLRPDDARNRYNLGVAYLHLGKDEKAREQFIRAEEQGRSDVAMLEKLGEAYTRMKDYERSEQIYEEILRKNRRNVRVLARLGEIHYEKGEYDRALEFFRRITDIEPATENARVAWINIGNILDDMQRYNEAIEAYNKALAISPKDHMAHYNLGIAYEHAGKPEKAVQSWQEASRLSKDDPNPRLAIADLYYQKGYYDEAEKAYRNITKDWPRLQEPHFRLASIYYKRDRFDFALKAFQRTVELDNNTSLARRALINIGTILASRANTEDEFEEARNSIQKALLIQPGDPEALFALGEVRARSGMHEKAVDTYYQALQGARESELVADIYNGIGKSYYMLGRYRKALQAFTRGLEESPSREDIRMNRKSAMNAYEKQLEEQR